MKYLLLFIGVFALVWTQPVSSEPLNFTYPIETNDWQYCQIHKEECKRIGNYLDEPILPKFDLQPAISNKQWAVFITLQVADIYTTYRGLKYDCVYETNPIFGERPSIMKMGATKFVILYPVIVSEQNHQTLSRQNVNDINYLMSLVVLNNHSVTNKVKSRCNK